MELRLPTVRRGERGSALVVTLLIMVVLSMTSIAFLVLGDTEVRLARTERDVLQPLYVAEGVVGVARSWFDDPDPASNHLLPGPDEIERAQRRGDLDWDGVDDDACDGSQGNLYRGGNITGERRLFDKPFRSGAEQTFWGRRDTPDIIIRPESPGDYLERLNRLFNSDRNRSLEGVRVVEIRMFAPPLARELRQRMGVATIEVTVDKYRGGLRIARRTVQAQVAEIPYPGPRGAIESQGDVEQSGSLGVHWGAVISERDIHLPPSTSANFPDSAIPRRAFPVPWWEDFSPGAVDRTPDDGELDTQGTQNLLTELLGLSVEGLRPPKKKRPGPAELEDPWLRYGAAEKLWEGGDELSDGRPWPWYWRPGDMPNLQEAEDRSHLMGRQPVQMTPVRYSAWKAVAVAGGRNVHYLTFSGLSGNGEPLFRRRGAGPARSFLWWTNTETLDNGPGFYFFDTVNQSDPQNGDGILTPAVQMNPAGLPEGSGYLARGFLYLNATAVSSAGIGGAAVPILARMPGEPWLDRGLDLNGSGFVGDTEAERETIDNGRWDCDCDMDGDVDEEDAAWPFDAHDDLAPGGYPDRYHDPRTSADGGPLQVHEPFLNLDYPDPASKTWTTRVDFTAAGDLVEDGDGDPTSSSDLDRFTTKGRDDAGALVRLPCNLWGVFYNEGRFAGSGNLKAYGSLLMRESFDGSGSVDVWFDESLVRGEWPPPDWGLPRVTVTALYDAPL